MLRGPANKGLKKFVSHFDGKETLTVQVPGMAFSVTPRLQSAATTSRLRLEFQAESDVVYELQFKQRLHDAWSSVPFAIAADGVVDQSNWSGPEGPMSFYVERSSARGYYSIFMDWVEV